MRPHLLTLAVFCALAMPALPAVAQFATLPPADAPMRFSPAQCGALREIEGGVATRSAADIERIGAAMEANQNADPVEVARISGLSVPTVSTMGALNQQDAMAFSLVFGSMLRHYHPDLLMKVLRERAPLGQVPDISGNPFGMAVLDGMLNAAQQSYLTQCS
ncbi:hypothetical protein [Paenirhodobacter populi]|uniref:Uncharacterized protein n=1 Tax=Paenirhodobacter populi TaxID=2306993 RepID=A0A443IS06_9RHOB|nr:hypothetical protein [Sinirhodobacter populi]RWR10438.1 hypothetical protein D2T33_12300 [Sinirhodobacter populi]